MNRVVTSTEANQNMLQYTYDEDGEKTYYIYGQGLIGEERSDGEYKTYHYDLRGSTTALTDEDGNVTDSYSYGVYGDVQEHTGQEETIFLYNGQSGVESDENGLYYLRSRYYSPYLKRFLNADTYKGEIQKSVSMNTYAFANGNPISMIDPFGNRAAQYDTKYDTYVSEGTSEDVSTVTMSEFKPIAGEFVDNIPSYSMGFYVDGGGLDATILGKSIGFEDKNDDVLLSVELVSGEAGIAKVGAEMEYGGYSLSAVKASGSIEATLDGFSSEAGIYGKVALIEATGSFYIPILFTDKKFEIEVTGDLGSLGGGISFEDSQLKFGGHFIAGADLTLGIK